MYRGINFVDFLMSEIALCILSLLDDPADIVRVSAVSRSWRHFVISNGLSKKLCLGKVPALTNITSVVEKRDVALIMDRDPFSWGAIERDHKTYTSFLQALTLSKISQNHCIACGNGASSSNRYPEESIAHILLENDQFTCWFGTGQRNPNVPESIIFKLNASVCIVNEIEIQPSEGFWESGAYSALSVRFRMGYLRPRTDFEVNVKSLPLQQLEEEYVWTYTSPEFPVIQESYSQSFNLPEPVVCLGGYLQILCRAQRIEFDGLFYLRSSHFDVLGHHLSPALNVEMGSPGSLSLIYCPDAIDSVLEKISPVEEDQDGQSESGYGTDLMHFMNLPGEDPWFFENALALSEDFNRQY